MLDANVLYPAPVRDLLLSLAELDLYRPKWTDEIHEEWIRNLLLNRSDLKRESLEAAKGAMNAAFPEANVLEYAHLSKALMLPDSGDIHVVAAAIKAGADLIITSNLKHFPGGLLKQYDLAAQAPDEFLSTLINLDSEKCIEAFDNQVRRLKNPPKKTAEVLQTLSKCGLPVTAKLLDQLISKRSFNS